MHVVLISKAVNNFGILFPSLVFTISDLLLSLSFDALVFFLLLLRSNAILLMANLRPSCNQGGLESSYHSHQTSPGAYV